jgi:hypothetical protein
LEDLYSKEEMGDENFEKELINSLKINLVVNFGEDYYDSSLLGNFIEARAALKPKVKYPLDQLDENKKYTLMMFTPDHPFRLNPDKGIYLHWLM